MLNGSNFNLAVLMSTVSVMQFLTNTSGRSKTSIFLAYKAPKIYHQNTKWPIYKENQIEIYDSKPTHLKHIWRGHFIADLQSQLLNANNTVTTKVFVVLEIAILMIILALKSCTMFHRHFGERYYMSIEQPAMDVE